MCRARVSASEEESHTSPQPYSNKSRAHRLCGTEHREPCTDGPPRADSPQSEVLRVLSARRAAHDAYNGDASLQLCRCLYTSATVMQVPPSIAPRTIRKTMERLIYTPVKVSLPLSTVTAAAFIHASLDHTDGPDRGLQPTSLARPTTVPLAAVLPRPRVFQSVGHDSGGSARGLLWYRCAGTATVS
jgi:hypothetical protein